MVRLWWRQRNNKQSDGATGSPIVVHTDSKWVENCATGKWQKKANCDLWKQYESLSHDRSIRFVWVKGHSGNAYNNLVDDLARSEAKKYKTF
jgi:ribonuclease HI